MSNAPEITWQQTFDPQVLRFFSKRVGHGLPILHASQSKSEKATQFYQQFEYFQRYVLHGFTVRELSQIGCWDKNNAKPSDLAGFVPVHSLYNSERWINIPEKEIGHGIPGTYNYSNPIVQAALQPSLVLASLILANIDMWIW